MASHVMLSSAPHGGPGRSSRRAQGALRHAHTPQFSSDPGPRKRPRSAAELSRLHIDMLATHEPQHIVHMHGAHSIEVMWSIPQALLPPLGGRVYPAGQHTLNSLHDRAKPYRRGAGRRLQRPPPDPGALYHLFRAPCLCCTCAHSCASHAQCVHAHAHCLVGRALRAPRLCCIGAHSCASHAQCVHAHAHMHCLVGSALRALCAFAARVLINVHAHAQWLRACTCTCTLPR